MISCAVQEMNLTAAEGGSITLPDPVVKSGFLLYTGKNVAWVNDGKLKILEKSFINRLQWSSSSGLFTISDLQKNDSGIYHIDSKEGHIFDASYKLTVYESVLQPAVNTSSVSSDSCTLLCSVDEGDETTLSWYKGEEKVNQSSSDLSLLITVHKEDFNSSFTCVAANPADNKTLPVDVTAFCSGQNTVDETSVSKRHISFILIPIALGTCLVCLISTIYFLKGRRKMDTQLQRPVSREGSVLYTAVKKIGNSI
ncbi:hypothetical protein LDENG_00185400 [Lucifuga dentata]|nr:hypothetical protein LDENG_00185400 [Lucifuga dentata]